MNSLTDKICGANTHTHTHFFSNTMTVISGVTPLLGYKIIHLADKTDLFKASSIVTIGEETVTGQYGSLARQRQRGRQFSSNKVR
jgi:hypothetical protein